MAVLASACLTEERTPLLPDPASAANSTIVIDACGLFTAEEAASALGSPIDGGSSSSSNDALGHKVCLRTSTKADSEKVVRLSMIQTSTISASERKKGTTAATEYSKAKTEAGKKPSGAAGVSGLGDTAFWDGVQLHILKGDTYATVRVGTEKAGNQTGAEAIARKATARLK